MPATVGELLDDAEAQIKACEAIELWRPYMARLEAASLLGFIIGHDPEQSEEVVPAAARRRFDDLIARRLTGEPAALIIGTTTFRGLELRTRPGVFIPRSSSESLAGEAVRRLRRRRHPVAVDVPTGSGPVPLAVASEVPAARVYGVDISPPALSLAGAHATRLHLPNVTFLRSDVLSALPKDLERGVDVITVHPPYVARSMMRDLPVELRCFDSAAS